MQHRNDYENFKDKERGLFDGTTTKGKGTKGKAEGGKMADAVKSTEAIRNWVYLSYLITFRMIT